MTDQEKAIRLTLDDIDQLIKIYENSEPPELSEAAYETLCSEADRLEQKLAQLTHTVAGTHA